MLVGNTDYHLMLLHKTYKNQGICYVTLAICYVTKNVCGPQ